MSDDKLEYYATMLKKIRNKQYEYLVISRVLHLLNDEEIEFTTQQLVRVEDKRFHLDLYFPQLQIAVEVDENYHKNQVEKDKEREKAVIDAVNLDFERIDASGKSFIDVCARVDDVVRLVKSRKKLMKTEGRFVPFGRKYDLEYWRAKKVISVSDDARFRTHVDVANTIFGFRYRGHQQALIRLAAGKFVWFPKLYENGDWDNQLKSNDTKIVQTELVDRGRTKTRSIGDMMVVFADHKNELGQRYYAFKGVFKLESQRDTKTTYVRCFDELRFDGQENGYSFANPTVRL